MPFHTDAHLVLVRLERAHREEGNVLIEDRCISGDAHVVVDDVRKPREVVGEPGAHAALARPTAVLAALGVGTPGGCPVKEKPAERKPTQPVCDLLRRAR